MKYDEVYIYIICKQQIITMLYFYYKFGLIKLDGFLFLGRVYICIRMSVSFSMHRICVKRLHCANSKGVEVVAWTTKQQKCAFHVLFIRIINLGKL